MASERYTAGSTMPVAAPPAGTSLALTETRSNIAELIKLGLRDNMDHEQATGMLKHVKHNLKKVDEFEESEKRPHLDELNIIRDKYKPMRAEWQKCETELKAMVSKYLTKVEDERREAQRILDKEAADKRARLEKQAEKASKAGRHEQAALIADHAATVVAPVLQSEAPKVAGVSSVDVYNFEVTDPAKVPKEYWIIDLKALLKIVRTLKESAKMIPGIRVWKEKQIRSGSEQPEV